MTQYNRETLLALADRTEKATGPDRELDVEIWLAVNHPDYRFPCPVLNRVPSDYQEALSRHRWDGGGGHYAWLSPTTSLDAAMSLVPEGWDWMRWSPGSMVVIRPHANGKMFADTIEAKAATPALALCAAALRARATLDLDGEKA